MEYYSYNESKEYLKKFNIKSSFQFYRLIKDGSLSQKINKRPYSFFKTKKRNNWISWEDFLSFKKCEQKKKFLSFDESLKIVRKLHLKNQKDWVDKFKELNLSYLKIPSNPNIIYKDTGWISYSHWLGLSSYKNVGKIEYLSYDDCKKYIKLHFSEIKNKVNWTSFDKSKLPLSIPKRPDYIYKKNGDWINWENFLDSDISPRSKSKLLLNFEDAKKYIKDLKFKDQYEFYKYIDENDINFLPKRPDYIYRKDWTGYIDFLGCVNNKESIGERLVKTYLDENKINYIREKRFDTCKNIKCLPFDFYLPDHNICIEYDGQHHFNIVSIYGGEDCLKKTQINDNIKNNWCSENNIKLIRISYIKKNKIYTILNEFFNNI
jgi:very-short-patch-repair endonuclease/acyl-CoA-binding protein